MSRRRWVRPVVGDRLRKAAPPGMTGALAHVLAVVETPDDGTHVVIRSWSATKQRWFYEVLCDAAFVTRLWTIDAAKRAGKVTR